MTEQAPPSRRDFLKSLGVTVGGAATVAAAGLPAAAPALAQAPAMPPKGNIPDKPFKVGHMTFFTGAAAVLGEPSYKGLMLAVDEINAQGGLLGKRKIEVLKADENAGTDANVKEMRRMKLSENIDLFTGVISSGNTPALGPGRRGAEAPDDLRGRLHRLPVRQGGAEPPLHLPDHQHPVGRRGDLRRRDRARRGASAKKIAHIHPDYSYGRNAFAHLNIAMKKLMGNVEVVSEGWPKLGTTDFTSHITKAISAKPDLLVSSVWGGDYVAMYKQALRYDMFKKMKFASTIAFGVAPHAIGKDHPEGAIAGVHSNYYFTNPPSNRWPLNTEFVKKYYDKFKEYPNFQSEGSYVTMYMLKNAIERANRLAGGWPDDDAIISQLENLSTAGPAGYIHIRPDNHQAYKDAVTGFSKNVPEYPFQILDPKTVITIPIRNITAPPGWPKGEPTSTYTWIDKTWPSVS